MQQRIETALFPLLGQPLTDCWRPNGKGYEAIQRFEFGVQHSSTNSKGEEKTFGEYAMHVGCPWRIIGQGRILVAYIDLYFPADNPTESGGDEDFDSSAPGGSQSDRQAHHFVERLQEAPLFVESIQADEVGSVCFTFSRNYRLEILPMDSLPFEFWRMLHTGAVHKQQKHFVVTGQGIED